MAAEHLLGIASESEAHALRDAWALTDRLFRLLTQGAWPPPREDVTTAIANLHGVMRYLTQEERG